MLFWYQSISSANVIYAMRLDRYGNWLWQNPVLISQPGNTGYKDDIHAAVDHTGYTYVVWHEDLSDHIDIYAQRIIWTATGCGPALCA